VLRNLGLHQPAELARKPLRLLAGSMNRNVPPRPADRRAQRSCKPGQREIGAAVKGERSPRLSRRFTCCVFEHETDQGQGPWLSVTSLDRQHLLN